jgi:aminoglycoside phosphotransferase (APT) family kinase protein
LWREGRNWKPGLIIGHGDPAPYNAVWNGRLIGLIDWDNAGPVDPQEDAAWVAFAWTPLHARVQVLEEGFTDFTQRPRRLAMFLEAYEWSGTVADALDLVHTRLGDQIRVMRALAAQGDPAYVAMLGRGQD